MYKMLRDRMVVLFLLLPFYFNSFQHQTDKKPEANSSARKLIINHKQNYSLYPNLVSWRNGLWSFIYLTLKWIEI